LVNYTVEALIPLIRDVMYRFGADDRYKLFQKNLQDVVPLESSRDYSLYKRNEVRRALEALQAPRDRSSVQDEELPSACIRALAKADWDEFRLALRYARPSPEFKKEVMAYAKSIIDQLRSYAKTIANLQYFLGLDIWPLGEPWLSRVQIIYRKHAWPFLPEMESVFDSGRDYCSLVCEDLMRAQSSLADSLPQLIAEMRAKKRRSIEERGRALEEEIQSLTSEVVSREAEINEAIKRAVEPGVPSLRLAFREAARKKKIQTFGRSAENALIQFGAAWTKPDLLLKLMQAIHH
jgi:hypothetical protein